MAVYVCGDTHCEYDIKKITTRHWKEQRNLSKNDYLIVLGDFGIHFKKDKLNERMIEWYDNKRMNILFLPGNHDNYEILNNLPDIEMFGSTVKKLSNNVHMLKRGYIYNIDEKIIFTMGGGESIDKIRRKDRITWWEEEIPSYKEIMNAFSNLDKYNYKVDYILTHTCSNKVFSKLSLKIDLIHKDGIEKSLRDFFDWIEDNVSFKEWHFAHFHDDIKVDDKHYLWYNSLPKELY